LGIAEVRVKIEDSLFWMVHVEAVVGPFIGGVCRVGMFYCRFEVEAKDLRSRNCWVDLGFRDERLAGSTDAPRSKMLAASILSLEICDGILTGAAQMQVVLVAKLRPSQMQSWVVEVGRQFGHL
jgi:hypothetical protein